MVNFLAGFPVREKAGVFVGARMGRPEKAKERRMAPYVHSLYPVGEAGGPQRDILKAEKGKTVKSRAQPAPVPRLRRHRTPPPSARTAVERPARYADAAAAAYASRGSAAHSADPR